MFPKLSIENLHICRKNNSSSKKIINGISFDINEGEILDITGPSGCGKSTLLEAIAYMIPKDSGNIFLDGKSQDEFKPIRWRGKVSLLMQKAVVVQGSVKDNLLLPWTMKLRKDLKAPSENDLRRYLDKIELTRIPLNRSANELSGGEQSRVSLLRSLLTNPEVLLLDEPDASLDKESARAMLEILLDYLSKNRGTIIRVQHHHWYDTASKKINMKNPDLEI